MESLSTKIVDDIFENKHTTHTYYCDISPTIPFITVFVEEGVIYITDSIDSLFSYRIKYQETKNKLESKVIYTLKYIKERFENVK